MDKIDNIIDNELYNEIKCIYCSTPNLIAYDLCNINELIKFDVSCCYFKASRVLSTISNCLNICLSDINEKCSTNSYFPTDISEHFQVLQLEYKNQLKKKIIDHRKGISQFINSSYRLKEVVRWFIKSIYPNILHKDYEIIFETEIEDLSPNIFNQKTIDFNNDIFGKQSTRLEVGEYLEINGINPYLHLYAINKYSYDIIGTLEIYPLSISFLEKLEKDENMDELLELDSFPFENILTYDKPGLYSIYINTIATHSYFRGKYILIQKMLEKYFDLFIDLAKKNIFISSIYAEAWSKQGYDLAKYFGMTEIRKTKNGNLFKLSLHPVPDFSKLKMVPKNAITLFESYNRYFKTMFPTVFISYNHSDFLIAEKIKQNLENYNCNVIIDQYDLEAGKSIEDFIKDSIKNSDTTISIVSESSLLSAWVAKESIFSMYDEQIRQRKFIPCYIDKGFLDNDFTDKALSVVDCRIKKINEIISNRLEFNIGFEDLQDERTRNLQLKNNLPNIIAQFRNTHCIDLSDENFEVSIKKVQKSITNSKIQRL